MDWLHEVCQEYRQWFVGKKVFLGERRVPRPCFLEVGLLMSSQGLKMCGDLSVFDFFSVVSSVLADVGIIRGIPQIVIGIR